MPRSYHGRGDSLLSVIVVMAGIALAPPAHADDKPALAVLGVVPMDEALIKAADAMTATIRAQAAAKKSNYRVLGTAKEVESAVMTGECSTIQPSCAVKLGAQLGAGYAVAGELERRG